MDSVGSVPFIVLFPLSDILDYSIIMRPVMQIIMRKLTFYFYNHLII